MGKYDSLLSEYQRNSTDDFTGGVDWKPMPRTKLTFEEEIDHYKADSFFTIAPQEFHGSGSRRHTGVAGKLGQPGAVIRDFVHATNPA